MCKFTRAQEAKKPMQNVAYAQHGLIVGDNDLDHVAWIKCRWSGVSGSLCNVLQSGDDLWIPFNT